MRCHKIEARHVFGASRGRILALRMAGDISRVAFDLGGRPSIEWAADQRTSPTVFALRFFWLSHFLATGDVHTAGWLLDKGVGLVQRADRSARR